MKNNLKIFSLLGFLIFAAFSTWATAESLILWQPELPLIVWYGTSFGFFVIASYGTKLIVDSLNQNIYLEKRAGKLIGGTILILLFWLVCSMPTNTHTFFYRSLVNDKVTSDISATRGYLGQIKNNTNNKDQATLKINELNNSVDVILGELEAEIKNEANPGFGSQSKEILRKFAALLGVSKIDPLSFKGVSKQDRDRLCDAYRSKIYILRDSKAANIRTNILSPNTDNLIEVEAIDENLFLVKKYIDEKQISLNVAKDIKDVCDKLNTGYSIINKNRDFVNFSSEADKVNYTADNSVTKTARLLSVVDVWKDFINGKYAGRGFVFWIIISILIDVAAFIFFDIAFKK